MWQRAILVVLLTVLWHVLCLVLWLWSELTVFLLAIIPGWLVAVMSMGYRFDLTREENIEFCVIWVATSVLIYSPVVNALLPPSWFQGPRLPPSDWRRF